MKYLEDDKLTALNSELADAALGDSRVINGRIEAYTMKRGIRDKKYAHALRERYVAEMEVAENQLAEAYHHMRQLLPPSLKHKRRSQSVGALPQMEGDEEQSSSKRRRACSFDSTKSAESLRKHPSALGDFQEMSTRRLMTDLILTLNASFPDYDFGAVRPSHFTKVPLDQVMKDANERLGVFLSRNESFVNDLWTAIDQVISLEDAVVYSFTAVAGDDDPLGFLTQTLVEDDSATPLWSFNYFFVNKHMKRIVLFSCVETMSFGETTNDSFVTKSVGYYEPESNFDMDPASDVAGGFPVDLQD